MDKSTQELTQKTDQVEVKVQQSSSWPRTLSIGLGVVGIGIAIGIGGYLLGTNKVLINPTAVTINESISPTPADETANWKTYTNSKYSFKYPLTHNVRIDDPNGKMNPTIVRAGDLYAARGLYVDWELYFGYKGERQDNFDINQKVVAGSIYITRALAGKDVYFGCQFNDDKSEIDTCNQILSTFKFTTQNQTTDTSDWKTYFNDDFGYKLQYPADGSVITENDGSIRITLPREEKGTLLQEKYLNITSTRITRGVCGRTLQGETYSRSVAINGKTFTMSDGGDDATGNIYRDLQYAITANNICYFFKFTLHSVNPDMFGAPTTLKKYDEQKETAIYTEILSTFKFIQ